MRVLIAGVSKWEIPRTKLYRKFPFVLLPKLQCESRTTFLDWILSAGVHVMLDNSNRFAMMHGAPLHGVPSATPLGPRARA